MDIHNSVLPARIKSSTADYLDAREKGILPEPLSDNRPLDEDEAPEPQKTNGHAQEKCYREDYCACGLEHPRRMYEGKPLPEGFNLLICTKCNKQYPIAKDDDSLGGHATNAPSANTP
jgi:hypothetical protein